jgi:hypothetical protein
VTETTAIFLLFWSAVKKNRTPGALDEYIHVGLKLFTIINHPIVVIKLSPTHLYPILYFKLLSSNIVKQCHLQFYVFLPD